MTRVGTRFYCHADNSAGGLGCVTEISTNGRFKLESCMYDMCGAPTVYDGSGGAFDSSAISDCLLFGGRDGDGDIGLYNHRHR